MKEESEMRLGEFRTKTRDCENKLKIRLSVYDDIKYNADGYIELDIDMVTDNNIYLRPMGENNDEMQELQLQI